MTQPLRRRSLTAGYVLLACALGASAAWSATPDELYGRGLKAYLDGDYATAASDLKQALQADPAHAQAKELLALVQETQQQGQPQSGVLSQLSGALEAQQQENTRLKAVLATTEQRLSQLTAQQQTNDRAIAGLQAELASARQEMKDGDLRNAKAMDQAKLKIQALESQSAKLDQELAERDQERTTLRSQLFKSDESLAAAKTEIEQLRVVRNENDLLKRSLAKSETDFGQADQDRARLKDEVAGLKKQVGAEAKLRKDVEELTSKVGQRDDQLEKLRQINGTLDQQFADTEASQRKLEDRLRTAEQQRDALTKQLADTQESLKASKEQAKRELTSLQQQFQQQQGDLTKQLDELSGRHDQTVRELEALHTTQISLQERLVAAREKNVSLDANLTGLQESKTAMEKAVKDRDLESGNLRKDLDNVKEALRLSEKELLETKTRLADAEQDRKNLQEQVRVAKETQATFNAQLKDLQAIQNDRDKTQVALNERETRLTKLQGEMASLTRDYDTVKRQLQVQEAEGSEVIEQSKIDQKGLEWRVESLERELEEANATAAKSKVEIDSQTRKLADLETFKQQLAGKLEQREEQLRQSESVIRLLRGEQPASAPDLPVAPPVAHIDLEPGPVQDGSPAVMPDAGSAVPQTLGSEYKVKVYQVNDEFHFVVFSMEDEDTAWAKNGTQLLLVSEDQDKPLAAVQLTELDSAGFAVAQVIQTIDPARQLRKGDLLLARPLASPIGQ